MIVKTEAVVLKAQKYLESSAIVTLYTRSFGKMSVIAKGARRRQSALSPVLGAMNHVGIVVYRKEGRDLQTLSQCELRRPWRKLTEEMERMAVGMVAVDLLNGATHFDEPHEDLFDLLISTLECAETATNPPRNTLYYFEMHLLETLGFKPVLTRCVKCTENPIDRMGDRKIHAIIVDEGILCSSCAGGGVGGPELSGESIQVLRRLQEFSTPEKAERVVISAAAREEVESVLRWLLRRHVTGARALKSESVFSSLSKLTH